MERRPPLGSAEEVGFTGESEKRSAKRKPSRWEVIWMDILPSPKNPDPQTHWVLRVRTPAMEGPTPAMESPRILRVIKLYVGVCDNVVDILSWLSDLSIDWLLNVGEDLLSSLTQAGSSGQAKPHAPQHSMGLEYTYLESPAGHQLKPVRARPNPPCRRPGVSSYLRPLGTVAAFYSCRPIRVQCRVQSPNSSPFGSSDERGALFWPY